MPPWGLFPARPAALPQPRLRRGATAPGLGASSRKLTQSLHASGGARKAAPTGGGAAAAGGGGAEPGRADEEEARDKEAFNFAVKTEAEVHTLVSTLAQVYLRQCQEPLPQYRPGDTQRVAVAATSGKRHSAVL